MTLANITEIIKKVAWIFAAILLITLLLVLIYLRNSDKKEDLKVVLIEKPKIEFLQIGTSKFETKNLSLPKNPPTTLSIFNVYPKNFLNEASITADRLDFKNLPKNLEDATFGKGLLFSNEN